MPFVRAEFSPEPDPATRAALEAALPRLLREPDVYASAWRRAALPRPAEAAYATAPLRRSPGAARA
jgi:hypothetical protein